MNFDASEIPIPRDSSRYVANTMDQASRRIDDALAAHIAALDSFVTRVEALLEKYELAQKTDSKTNG